MTSAATVDADTYAISERPQVTEARVSFMNSAVAVGTTVLAAGETSWVWSFR